MKKFLIALMVVASSLSIAVSEAQAKRLGGGGSFGKQSSGVSRSAPAQNAAKPAAPPAAAPAAVPPKPASPWRGILGGALLGLGLGALLSHFGIGGGLASMISSILMIGLLVFAVMFIYRMFRRKTETASPAFAGGAGGYGGGTPEIGSHVGGLGSAAQPHAFQPDAVMAGETTTPWGVPADFDVPGFLRSAKTYYIRLQTAWDAANIVDIREFATPEMFAELRLQLQERGASPNHTDVVSLDAALLGIERVGDEYLASVKFSGLIKEAQHAAAEPFQEVWNLSKPVSGQGGWLLAGIQQLS